MQNKGVQCMAESCMHSCGRLLIGAKLAHVQSVL